MDRLRVALTVLVLAIVGLGAYQVATACAWSSVEATDEGMGEETCETRFAVPPFLLLGFMLLAGVGIAFGRLVVAWSGAVLALAGCVILGLSWGGLLFFHALGIVGAVTLWHLWGPRRHARLGRGVLAVVLSLPLGLFGLYTLVTATPVLWDPCHEWGSDDGSLEPGADGCAVRSSSGDIGRLDYALLLASTQGGAVAAVVLAGLGAWRSRMWMLATAGACWAIVAVAWMFTFGLPFIPFALLAAVACGSAAWGLRGGSAPHQPEARHGRRGGPPSPP